jgi:uncharacterized protein (TIGR00369 family)
MLSNLSPEETLRLCNEDTCHKEMGIVGEEINKKQAICLLNIKQWHLNVENCVHGGILTALLDSTMALAVYPNLESNEKILAIDLKVNFLKPATFDMKKVKCHSDLVSRTRRLAVTEGEVLSPTGEILCKALGTFAIIKKK